MSSIDKPNRSALGFTKFFLLVLVFLTAAETFSRVGIATTIWLAIYAAVSFFILLELDDVLGVLSRNWIIVLTPIIALTSVFWSPVPEWTFRASMQLLFTVMIGVWIGMTFQALIIFKALALAMGIGLFASLLNYYFQFIPSFDQGDYIGAERYFVGIYKQKNVFGKVFDLFALSLLIITISSRKFWLALFILLALIIPLLEVKSVSSLIAYLIIMTFPILMWIQNNVENITILVIFIIIIVLVILFIAITDSIDILNNVLAIVGKDSTFTGRTVFWEVGAKIIAENPILGVGFQAYWQPGQFAEYKSLHIVIGEQINGFHNVYIEVLVGTGIVGLLAYIGIHIKVLMQTFRLISHNNSVEALGTLYLVIMTILLSQINTIGFRQHEMFLLLLVTFTVMTSKVLRLTEK